MLALIAGFLYASSAVLCKRGLELGAGTLRSLICSNLFMSLCFLPYPFFAEKSLSISFIFYGSILGLLFFISQMLCFIALRKGDASLMTPIMGSKPVFVAIFIAVFNLSPHSLNFSTWLAVGLAFVAIALIGWPGKKSRFSFGGLGFAIFGAAGFGLLDSLVPFLTNQADPFNLLFVVFGTVGLFSLFLIPFAEKKLVQFCPKSDIWMWLSAVPMGGQAICMSMAIGFYQVPTEANVFYAGRGIWSILMVAAMGKWMGLEEVKSSLSVMTRRALGSLLLLAGVYLIAI